MTISSGLTEDQQFSPDGLIKLSNRVGQKHALDRVAFRMRVEIPSNPLTDDGPELVGNKLTTQRLIIGLGRPQSIYVGGDHGLIVAFLSDAASRGEIDFPLRITNFDFHADVDEFQAQHVGYTASWQRVGLNLGLWSVEDNINVRPPHSKAVPNHPGIATDLRPDDLIDLPPSDVVSVDLDYFNDLSPRDDAWKEGMAVMKNALSSCRVAMLFSSPGWTSNNLDHETLRAAVAELLQHCRQNGCITKGSR